MKQDTSKRRDIWQLNHYFAAMEHETNNESATMALYIKAPVTVLY